MPARNLKDASLIVTTALPAQNTTGNTASLDLGVGNFDGISLRVNVPATPSLANSQTLTITIQDSADNSSFAAVAQYETIVMTGAGGVGSAAVERTYPLTPSIRRYVRISVAASATAGDNTAVSSTYALIF